jgi:hypothetical protein
MNGLARASILTLPLAATLLLAGCANPDRMLFVTSTSVGLGFDATTATGHLGFDRQEAYVGPDYPIEKGALPPVAAALQSDLDWFSPKIAQFYATGDAALIATGKIKAYNNVDTTSLHATDPACALNQGCGWSTVEDRRLSIVATNTHVGLVVTTKDATVSKLDFGYGRQEVSLLPLGTETLAPGGVTTHKDYFPSVFASINVNGAGTPPGESGGQGQGGNQAKAITGLPLTQFFATGGAADALASSDAVKKQFGKMSDDSAVAAAAAHEQSLAASLGMSDDKFKALTAKGGSNATLTQSAITKSVAKLLGREAKDDEALSDGDKGKIAEALKALPDRLSAYKLPDTVKTAGDFRVWLDKNDDVAQALIKQQGV